MHDSLVCSVTYLEMLTHMHIYLLRREGAKIMAVLGLERCLLSLGMLGCTMKWSTGTVSRSKCCFSAVSMTSKHHVHIPVDLINAHVSGYLTTVNCAARCKYVCVCIHTCLFTVGEAIWGLKKQPGLSFVG